jgi:hypothetical protein
LWPPKFSCPNSRSSSGVSNFLFATTCNRISGARTWAPRT